MPRPESGSRCATATAVTVRHMRRHARVVRQLALLIGLAAAHVCVQAIETPAVLSVDTSLAVTDNGESAASSDRRSDVIASIRPRLRWKRRGSDLEVDLDAAAKVLGHSNAERRGRVLPDVRASLRSTLVEKWLIVDADARVRQAEARAYGTRADDSRVASQRTEGTYSLRPHVQRLLAPDTLLSGAYSVTLTTNGADAGARGVTRSGVIRLERLPVPFGAAVEFARLDTETGRAERSRLSIQTLRVSGSTVLADEWTLGAVAGQERVRFLGNAQTDPLYGVDLKWKPTLRTSVAASVEHRFFGVGGAMAASHRTPNLSLGVLVSRQPALAPSALRVGSNADLRTYLDAILTTRYPDAAVRDGVVDSLLRAQGIDTRAPVASTVVAQYPQLLTTASAHVALLGRRDTAAVTVFVQTSRLLEHRGDTASTGAGVPIVDDSRQFGASFQLNHRLTPQVSAEAIVRLSRIVGFAERSGDASNETVYRLTLLRHVSDQYALSAGLQHNRFETNVAGLTSYQATTLFVGASYQF